MDVLKMGLDGIERIVKKYVQRQALNACTDL